MSSRNQLIYLLSVVPLAQLNNPVGVFPDVAAPPLVFEHIFQVVQLRHDKKIT